MATVHRCMWCDRTEDLESVVIRDVDFNETDYRYACRNVKRCQKENTVVQQFD